MPDNPITADDFLVLRAIDDALDRAKFSENGNARAFIRRLIDSVKPELLPGEYMHSLGGVRYIVTFDGESAYYDKDKAVRAYIHHSELVPLRAAVTADEVERVAIMIYTRGENESGWPTYATERGREDHRRLARNILRGVGLAIEDE